jgi:hypothetical protein
LGLSYEDNPLEEPEEDPENEGEGTSPFGQFSALYPPHPDPPTTPGSGSSLSPSGERFSSAVNSLMIVDSEPTVDRFGSNWTIGLGFADVESLDDLGYFILVSRRQGAVDGLAGSGIDED